MSAGEWYSYNDIPGDTAMNNFSIERDLKPNGLITYIKEARKFGHFLITSGLFPRCLQRIEELIPL